MTRWSTGAGWSESDLIQSFAIHWLNALGAFRSEVEVVVGVAVGNDRKKVTPVAASPALGWARKRVCTVSGRCELRSGTLTACHGMGVFNSVLF
jgi:hypothetical protein